MALKEVQMFARARSNLSGYGMGNSTVSLAPEASRIHCESDRKSLPSTIL